MPLHNRHLYPMKDGATRTTATLTKSGGATDLDSGSANDLFVAGPAVGYIWTVFEVRLTIWLSTTQLSRPDYYVKGAVALTYGLILRKGTGSSNIVQLHTDAIKDNAALLYQPHKVDGRLLAATPFTTADYLMQAIWSHEGWGAGITLVGDDAEEIQCLIQDTMPGSSDMYGDIYYEQRRR